MKNCPHCFRDLALKVYIASRYEDREDALALKKFLEEHGFIIVAQWLTPKDDDQPMEKIKDNVELVQEIGERAIRDIYESDVIVVMSPKKAHGTGTGGRHVELGIAMGSQKGIVIYGERENVFHFSKVALHVQERNDLVIQIRMAHSDALHRNHAGRLVLT